MQGVVLVAMVLCSSIVAHAEWTGAYASSDGRLSSYIDFSTIKRNASKVKVWVLFDYPAPQRSVNGMPFKSSKMQYEFECEEEQSRLLFLISHAENMGAGSIVVSTANPDVQWTPIPPDTVESGISKLVCFKPKI